MFIQTCQQLQKAYLIRLTTPQQKHSTRFLFKHFPNQHAAETREPTPALLPQVPELSNAQPAPPPPSPELPPSLTQLLSSECIYLPCAGLPCACWHKWSHGSRSLSHTQGTLRACWGSLGVCMAQTSQAAGLRSVCVDQSFRAVADRFVLTQLSKQQKILLLL